VTSYLDGIDISKWQPTTPPLAGQSFAFARATYATTVDPKYAMHVANFRRAGLVVGAYHFGVGFVTPLAQVKAFVAVAKDADLLVLDLERDTTKTMTRAQGREFIRRLRAAAPGKTILLYSSRGTWPGDLGQDANWVADYTGQPDRVGVSPRIPWAFWQWTSRPWDKNRFAGDLAELRALARVTKPVPQPPTSTEEEQVIVVTIEKFPAPRRFTAAGPLRRFTAREEIEPPIPAGYAGWADATVAIESSGVPHGAGFLRLSSGGSAGNYVLAAQVALEGE
jgi:hypothetical protein